MEACEGSLRPSNPTFCPVQKPTITASQTEGPPASGSGLEQGGKWGAPPGKASFPWSNFSEIQLKSWLLRIFLKMASQPYLFPRLSLLKRLQPLPGRWHLPFLQLSLAVGSHLAGDPPAAPCDGSAILDSRLSSPPHQYQMLPSQFADSCPVGEMEATSARASWHRGILVPDPFLTVLARPGPFLQL